jgi:serine/threonine protein kinase
MKKLFVRKLIFCLKILSIHIDFGLTYCPNGDLLQYITDAGHLEEEVVRFYSAELIEALEQLHMRHIIHRDLKVIEENLIFYYNDLNFSKAGKHSFDE